VAVQINGVVEILKWSKNFGIVRNVPNRMRNVNDGGVNVPNRICNVNDNVPMSCAMVRTTPRYRKFGMALHVLSREHATSNVLRNKVTLFCVGMRRTVEEYNLQTGHIERQDFKLSRSGI
jgi:hypothetical protein